jgi:mannobiose 2-epimerase
MRRTIGGTAAKSQNTHLHVMEAYTGLLRAWPDPRVRAAQLTLVGLMLERILDPKTHHLGLYFDADWTPRSTAISYGHDIEAAWLLCEAAEVLADETVLARTREAAVQIARVTLAEGVSPLGGIYNEGGPHGITNANHEWWPQAEAAVGFLNAYQISGDPAFLRAADASWQFVEKYLVDRKDGEWFHTVDPHGKPQPRRGKAGIWKCPYHNGRACMEIADRVAAIKKR